MNTTADAPPIRDAATLILVRDAATAPKVLMGQRGARAAFMPNAVVFPGGAMDPGDLSAPLAHGLPQHCAARLRQHAGRDLATGLFAAAIRELWEETGLMLGAPGVWSGPVPEDWAAFAARGMRPDPRALAFFFRAITPPGRPRRFDARFFIAPAECIAGDLDDFSAASDELSHLQWIPLSEVRGFALPFITEIVLAEVSAALPHLGAPAAVPFFRNDTEVSEFLRLA